MGGEGVDLMLVDRRELGAIFAGRLSLHTDRLLSLSEDLPLVSVAVDERPRVESVLAELSRPDFDGLVTLERVRLLTDASALEVPPSELAAATKVTVYVGRHERVARRSAHQVVVDRFHRRGIAAAAVLLGVDGTAHGIRRRARFFAANADVPLMVMGVADGRQLAGLLPDLGALLARPHRSRWSRFGCASVMASCSPNPTTCPSLTPPGWRSGRSSWSTRPSRLRPTGTPFTAS